ncbi:hypothetical protein AAXB25_14775 [Paenibacillus lautus]|uniref:hypothetical protein n=1 Tax=Paenibacillus lautus TaxID=1401 RepID=UPI003D2A2AA2
MFKKIIIAVLLIVSFIGATLPVQADASTSKNTQGEMTDVRKIQHVSYSERENVFYVYSEEDAQGTAWVIDFKPLKGESLQQFKKRVVGRYLIVKYTGDDEITGKYIW